MLKKILQFAKKRKIIAGIIAVVLIISGYYGYKAFVGPDGGTRYVLASVEKGTLVVSVSGSGQVSAVDQMDIKSKVSGDITWIGMEADKNVWQGQAILATDNADIKKQIADAEWNLEREKENYDQIKIDAERSLETAYEDGQSSVSTTFFKLSDYMKDLKDVSGTDQSSDAYVGAYKIVLGQSSLFIQKFLDDYKSALDLFNKKFAFFREASDKNDRDTVYKLINDTLETTKSISRALESARHMYDAITVENYKHLSLSSYIDTMQSKIKSDVSSVYSDTSSLQKIKDTIDDTNKNTPKNIAVEQNNVQQKEYTLDELKKNLDNYTARAPFAGVIAKVNVKRGDSVSSGATLATIITKQKIAEISLNEVDAAKVKAGQKATLTFDAISGLNITGQVTEIDAIGTVAQGVVTYNVKIVFDTQPVLRSSSATATEDGDERVKTGMNASASIITEVKQNALLIPNSAVKSSGDSYYVEMLENLSASNQLLASAANSAGIASNTLPKQQSVEIGLTNDSMIEIASGLKEGDKVIARTINPSTAKSQQSQGQSLFQAAGTGNRNNVRVPTR